MPNPFNKLKDKVIATLKAKIKELDAAHTEAERVGVLGFRAGMDETLDECFNSYRTAIQKELDRVTSQLIQNEEEADSLLNKQITYCQTPFNAGCGQDPDETTIFLFNKETRKSLEKEIPGPVEIKIIRFISSVENYFSDISRKITGIFNKMFSAGQQKNEELVPDKDSSSNLYGNGHMQPPPGHKPKLASDLNKEGNLSVTQISPTLITNNTTNNTLDNSDDSGNIITFIA